MATIRKLTVSDIPEVTALFLKNTPEAHWRSAQDCAAYMRRLLFENPWRELDVPSWVAEADDRITAFYLLLPRRMQFRGETITVAVGCQMSVDPASRRSLTALQLAKAALTGPQDLTIADGAHEKSRDMWTALGGKAPLIYNLHWIRPLRPARSLLHALVSRRALPSLLANALHPLARLFDALAARVRWNSVLRESPGTVSEALQPSLIAAHIDELVSGELKPSYDAASIAWLLEETAAKTGDGDLRARAVRDDDGGLLGWYLYMLVRGGTCEVVQIAARGAAFERVFRSLLADAWAHGGGTLRGRAQPEQVETLSALHCWFRREGKCALTHSRRFDINAAIEKGHAYLSRLEGEWWLRLVSA